MAADEATKGSGITTRRYTGKSRLDAEAGFKFDWPALSARWSLVAEGWDDETHTLTVFLEPRGPRPEAEPAAPAGHPADPDAHRG